MRFDGKSNPQKAGDISITKLSNVTTPAHAGALAALIKTAGITPEDVEKKKFEDSMAEVGMDEFYETVWDMTYALKDSIFETVEDCDCKNKKEVIQSNIDNFTTALSGVVSANTVIKQGEDGMKKEEIDALIKANLDPLQAKLTTAEAIAKMTDVVKSHYGTLSDEDKVLFVAKTVDEQIAAVEATDVQKGEDESFVMNGTTVLKSAVGDAAFAVMKAQQVEIEKNRNELAVERGTRQSIEFAKMAEGLYPNLPGEHMAKGKVIAALKSMDKETQDTLNAMLKAGNVAMDQSEVFKQAGIAVTNPSEDSPESKLNKLAQDRANKNGVTFAKAYDEVLRTERGMELYDESLSA